jgi:hypothetical protein
MIRIPNRGVTAIDLCNRWAKSMSSVVLLLTLVALSACGGEKPAPDHKAGAPDSASGTLGSYNLALPDRWKGHFRVDSLSTQERGTALPGAVVFNYLPADTTIHPQALLVVAVYDSAAWQAVRKEGGPPPGDSVAAKSGKVFVVGLPQSNPFAPGSPDAMVFQLLELKPAELSALVQPR